MGVHLVPRTTLETMLPARIRPAMHPHPYRAVPIQQEQPTITKTQLLMMIRVNTLITHALLVKHARIRLIVLVGKHAHQVSASVSRWVSASSWRMARTRMWSASCEEICCARQMVLPPCVPRAVVDVICRPCTMWNAPERPVRSRATTPTTARENGDYHKRRTSRARLPAQRKLLPWRRTTTARTA